MSEILLEFDRDRNLGVLRRSDDIHPAVWAELRIAARSFDEDAALMEETIDLDWAAAVVSVRSIGKLRDIYGFSIRPVGDAVALIAKDHEERVRLRSLEPATLATVRSEDGNVMADLVERGWDESKRRLKGHQERDLIRLASLDHGANFSVPGAGKTTVGFALHLLIRDDSMKLLVVCPKSALGAWSEIVDEVLRDDPGNVAFQPFVRLDGSDGDIRQRLVAHSRYFLVTYDRLVRSPMLFREWMAHHNVHMMLDEAHRIKAGALSLRGRTVVNLRSLPRRRDILTGTPVPNVADDLATQFEFLYPTQRYGQRIRSGEAPRNIIANLYVRTTKDALEIPPMDDPIFVQVPMSTAQAAFYSWLRSITLPALRRALADRNIARPLRGSVLRLLQASSNSRWAATRTFEDSLSLGAIPEDLLHRVIAEGDSNKILAAAELARELVANGSRAIIWTGFRDNISRLVEILDESGVTFIDGSVPSGDASDPETREGRIAAFHHDGGPMVMVANPGASAEGISLHLACHDAIYLDRSYNGAHYLQSLDRIHRLGLPPGTRTRVTILQSVCEGRESIDHSVSRRLREKLARMDDILDDKDVRKLALAEEEGDGDDLERDVDLDDVKDLIDQILSTSRSEPADEG